MTIWSTPQTIFDALHAEFNFRVDLCADANNAKLPDYISRERSLAASWAERLVGGYGFLNPPYGRDIQDWTRKAYYEDAHAAHIVAFLPARTNAPWWHDHIMSAAAEIRFVRRKVSFANPAGIKGVPPWGCAIAIFRPQHTRATPLCVSWDYR